MAQNANTYGAQTQPLDIIFLCNCVHHCTFFVRLSLLVTYFTQFIIIGLLYRFLFWSSIIYISSEYHIDFFDMFTLFSQELIHSIKSFTTPILISLEHASIINHHIHWVCPHQTNTSIQGKVADLFSNHLLYWQHPMFTGHIERLPQGPHVGPR